MKYKMLLFVIITAILNSTSLFAHGIGVRGGYSYFLPAGEYDPNNMFPSHVAYAGLVYDSDLSSAGIFNIRVNIDMAILKLDSTGIQYIPGDYIVDGRVIFGFKFLRTKCLRIFGGPLLGIEVFDQKSSSMTYMNLPMDFTIGLAIGLNINIGKNLTLSLDAGYKIGIMGSYMALLSSIYSSYNPYDIFWNNVIMRHSVFAGVSVIFRFGSDYYHEQKNFL